MVEVKEIEFMQENFMTKTIVGKSPHSNAELLFKGTVAGKKVGVEERWVVRFFIIEIISYCEYIEHSLYYDSIANACLEYLGEKWWTEFCSKEDRTWFDKQSKNKNHWLYHYKDYEWSSFRLWKPKVTFESLMKLRFMFSNIAWGGTPDSLFGEL